MNESPWERMRREDAERLRKWEKMSILAKRLPYSVLRLSARRYAVIQDRGEGWSGSDLSLANVTRCHAFLEGYESVSHQEAHAKALEMNADYARKYLVEEQQELDNA